jgi:TRAP-type C4-dicarboxylate transport system permease small subunit
LSAQDIPAEGASVAGDAPSHRVLGFLEGAMAAANRLILGVAMAAMAAAAFVLTLSVILRYFLNYPTDWQDETAVFLMVGATFMTGAHVQERRGHVGIEALASLLPSRANRVRLWLCDAISFAFCSFFSWKCWTLWREAWVEGYRTTSTWEPPLWIPYLTMAAGMTLLSAQLCLQTAGPLLRKRKSQ